MRMEWEMAEWKERKHFMYVAIVCNSNLKSTQNWNEKLQEKNQFVQIHGRNEHSHTHTQIQVQQQ